MSASTDVRESWVGFDEAIALARQCELIGLPRSSYYYRPVAETTMNVMLMRMIDEEYLRHPFYGARRMAEWLKTQGQKVNRKRTRRLMQVMGIEAIYPKPRTSTGDNEHEKYPYLLGGLDITRPNQVWSADITYIRMRRGFIYLVAIIDWYSRYVLAWETSNTLDTDFCISALDAATRVGKPDIFNTDQGCQFTSKMFTGRLKDQSIRISMDGRGRALDNIFIERLWRSLKYEEVYLKDYDEVVNAVAGIGGWLGFYNHERPHQSLRYRTPWQVHTGQELSN